MPGQKLDGWILGTDFVEINFSPKENLKQQEIFISIIAIFLLVIYAYLVFKKRKRLREMKATEDSEDEGEEDEIADSQDEAETVHESSTSLLSQSQKSSDNGL